MTNEQRLISKLLLNKKGLIATSAMIFLTLSNVKEVQAKDVPADYEDEQTTEVTANENQQADNEENSAKEKTNDSTANEEELPTELENSDETEAEDEEQAIGQEKLEDIIEELDVELNEKQNETLRSLFSNEALTEQLGEAILKHDLKEFEEASGFYNELLTAFEVSETQEALLKHFDQLAEENKSLTDNTYEEQEADEHPEEQTPQADEEEAAEDEKTEVDESEAGTSNEDKETEVDESEEESSDEDAEAEIEESEEESSDKDTDAEVDEADEETSNEDSEAEVDESEEGTSDEDADIEAEETEVEDTEDTESDEETTETQKTTAFRRAVAAEKNVDYRGYLSNSSDKLYSEPAAEAEFEIRRVDNLQDSEVKIKKEVTVDQVDWVYIEVVGSQVAGWINKTGVAAEAISSEKNINYRGYLARANDTINTQPWGTAGYEEIRRVKDLQGKEVRILKEAQTQRATWLYIEVVGANVAGWVDKAGIDIETISSQKDLNYRGYLARANDTINTQPWGTPGYEENRRVKDLQGKEVKVLKEAQTQRATWLYIEVVGSNVAGWVDKAGIEVEATSDQKELNYRGYLARANDTINTQPWGTPGYEEIRRVKDLQGKEVKVLKEVQTQRATWLYVDVVGANVAGWIDKAGIEEETISSQKDVDYRGFLTRPGDTINSQPWGVPGYQQLRKVHDLEGREVHVTKEASTQRANWVYVEVVGTDISGWIDQAGVNQASVAYRTTHYSRTFEETLDLQMQHGYPQTDAYGGGWKHAKREDVAYYLNPENFVNSKNGTQPANIESLQIATATLNVRTGPSASYSRLRTVSRNEEYKVLDQANGWYKIDINGLEGWVSGDYVSLISEMQYSNLPNNEIATITTSALNVRKGPSTDYQVETLVYRNESYEVVDYSNGWYKIVVDGVEGWVSKNYVSISNNDINAETLQFLSLSSLSGITVANLNKELEGKGILENQGAALIEASQRYNINEIYLMSHALLETGQGTSQLATGVKVNGVTVYNMFGIGAYDGSALSSGSRLAYEEGWDTPEKAIIGGAEFIANSYINSSAHKQDTLYKMKWDPAKPGDHQYATDIGWAIKQTRMLDQIIELSNEYNLVLKFDIPVYK